MRHAAIAGEDGTISRGIDITGTIRPYAGPFLTAYVSTVDSGNLAGCLLTLQAGLAELSDAHVVSPRQGGGLADTIDVFLKPPVVKPTAGLPAERLAIPTLACARGMVL